MSVLTSQVEFKVLDVSAFIFDPYHIAVQEKHIAEKKLARCTTCLVIDISLIEMLSSQTRFSRALEVALDDIALRNDHLSRKLETALSEIEARIKNPLSVTVEDEYLLYKYKVPKHVLKVEDDHIGYMAVCFQDSVLSLNLRPGKAPSAATDRLHYATARSASSSSANGRPHTRITALDVAHGLESIKRKLATAVYAAHSENSCEGTTSGEGKVKREISIGDISIATHSFACLLKAKRVGITVDWCIEKYIPSISIATGIQYFSLSTRAAELVQKLTRTGWLSHGDVINATITSQSTGATAQPCSALDPVEGSTISLPTNAVDTASNAPNNYIKTSYENEFLYLGKREGVFDMARLKGEKFKQLAPLPKSIWGISPKNIEQRAAIDLLLDDTVSLVSLVGKAGTGKTLLALACGLKKVFDDGVYARILVSRPIVPLGNDIGYLPGTKDEKLSHWMQPIFDNLKFLCVESSGSEEGGEDTKDWLLQTSKIEMEAVTYIRGRSLPKTYVIIDEAQNLTPHEIKTVLSRAGAGTKVILTGDPFQIDNPTLGLNDNALAYVNRAFKGKSIYGNIVLDTTERSHLASLAAELL